MKRNIIDAALDAASSLGLIDRKTLLADCRFSHVSRVRQAAYLVARDNGAAYCRIGKRLSREHSTVMQGVRAARARVAADPAYASFVARVREMAA